MGKYLMRKKPIFFFIILVLLVLSGLKLVEADKEKPKRTTAIKETSGEVSGVGADYIAVVYDRKGQHDYEILIPLEKKRITMVHKRSLQEIKLGDRVAVQYDEITEEYKGRRKTDFKARTVTFLGPAAKEPEDEGVFRSLP